MNNKGGNSSNAMSLVTLGPSQLNQTTLEALIYHFAVSNAPDYGAEYTYILRMLNVAGGLMEVTPMACMRGVNHTLYQARGDTVAKLIAKGLTISMYDIMLPLQDPHSVVYRKVLYFASVSHPQYAKEEFRCYQGLPLGVPRNVPAYTTTRTGPRAGPIVYRNVIAQNPVLDLLTQNQKKKKQQQRGTKRIHVDVPPYEEDKVANEASATEMEDPSQEEEEELEER